MKAARQWNLMNPARAIAQHLKFSSDEIELNSPHSAHVWYTYAYKAGRLIEFIFT